MQYALICYDLQLILALMPLHPPGVRMSEALQDVRNSLDCNLQAKKGGGESRC